MILKGRFVTLRAIEERDLDMLRDLVNDPEIERAVCGWSFPVSSHQQRAWFEEISHDKGTLRLVIDVDNEGVGFIGIRDFDWKNRTCFPMLKLAKGKIRRKGLATDAMMTLMRYAFDELQFHRLDGAIIDENAASRALFLGKLGWREEGVRRACIFVGGVYHDVIQCGILKAEYDDLVQRTAYWGCAERSRPATSLEPQDGG